MLKSGPSFYFPFIHDTDISTLYNPTLKGGLKIGYYNSLSFIMHTKGMVQYGISVFSNSIISEFNMINSDEDILANQDSYSHVGLSFSLMINFTK